MNLFLRTGKSNDTITSPGTNCHGLKHYGTLLRSSLLCTLTRLTWHSNTLCVSVFANIHLIPFSALHALLGTRRTLPTTSLRSKLYKIIYIVQLTKPEWLYGLYGIQGCLHICVKVSNKMHAC